MGNYDPKSIEPFLIFSYMSPIEFCDRLTSRLNDEDVKADVDEHYWTIKFKKT